MHSGFRFQNFQILGKVYLKFTKHKKMRTQISNFIAYKLIDSQASTRGRFWPFSIKILYYFSLSTGANQKIIEKKADL